MEQVVGQRPLPLDPTPTCIAPGMISPVIISELAPSADPPLRSPLANMAPPIPPTPNPPRPDKYGCILGCEKVPRPDVWMRDVSMFMGAGDGMQQHMH